MNSSLLIFEPAEEVSKDSVAIAQAMQSGSADISALSLSTGVEAPMALGGEEETETEEPTEMSATTPEIQSAMAVVSYPTHTHISIYYIVVSSSRLSGSLTPTLTTISNCNAIFPNAAVLLFAIGQGPHLSSSAPQIPLVHSTLSAQAPISSPIVAPTHPLKISLDLLHVDFLQKKLKDTQDRKKKILLHKRLPNLCGNCGQTIAT